MKKVRVISILSVPTAVVTATGRTLTNPWRAKRLTHSQYYHGSVADNTWSSLEDAIKDCEKCGPNTHRERVMVAGKTRPSLMMSSKDSRYNEDGTDKVTNYCDVHRPLVYKWDRHDRERRA